MKRWLATSLALGLVGMGRAAPPNFTPPSQFAGGATLGAKETAEALEAFRAAGPAQPSYLEFALRHMPRRGAETLLHGRLWVSRDEGGAVYRIDIDGGAHFLLQNGPDAR